MHIIMTSIVVAMIVCVLLLVLFGLFTLTPGARRIAEHGQPKKRSPLG